jgi:hypothetical protein
MRETANSRSRFTHYVLRSMHHNLTIQQVNIPRDEARHRGIMRDDDDGAPFLPIEMVEQVEHFLTRVRVQVAGRLVGLDDARIVRQGTGDGDALLLSTGKLGGFVCHAVAQSNTFQQRLRARPSRRRGNAVENHGELYVLECRHRRDQVKSLEDKADFLSPVGCQIVLIQLRDVTSANPDFALGGTIQSAKQIEQRGLSRPRRPHHCQKIASIDLQVDAVQGVDDLVTHREITMEIVSVDNRAVHAQCNLPGLI